MIIKNKSIENFKTLNSNGIIDECFEADFDNDSKISKYIQTQIFKKTNK